MVSTWNLPILNAGQLLWEIKKSFLSWFMSTDKSLRLNAAFLFLVGSPEGRGRIGLSRVVPASGGGKVMANISVPFPRPRFLPFPRPRTIYGGFQSQILRVKWTWVEGRLSQRSTWGAKVLASGGPWSVIQLWVPVLSPGLALESTQPAAAGLGLYLAFLFITTSAVCCRETGRVLLWLAAFLWRKQQAQPINSPHSKSRKMNCNSQGPGN